MDEQIMAKIDRCSRIVIAALGVALITGMAHSTAANTLCVKKGTHSCYSTIAAALPAAASGDTIQVGLGVYPEMVIIDKPLSLIGAHVAKTVIDASGKCA